MSAVPRFIINYHFDPKPMLHTDWMSEEDSGPEGILDCCEEDRWEPVLDPRNYWCSEGTRNHQRVLTVMSRISRDIKPLLQHNSGNNLMFLPWLRSVDTVYVGRIFRVIRYMYMWAILFIFYSSRGHLLYV